ncbi:uncharacterized protein LOC128286832 [Gossypium arboreum]|uniref:uncharacterized protein LOC128286832 n=1 Tax=Gossypium arboreum TaxID=29729 RepID=UPI0022F17FE9|nr:uncharacterized protein LOC128286832 [Gossypium arboreum]
MIFLANQGSAVFLFGDSFDYGNEDDLVLFGQAEEDQATLLKKVLDSFCAYSGHKINAHKTNVCFLEGVSDVLGSNLCCIIGFRKVNNIGSYLGVPLFHEKVTNNSLCFVVDKSMLISKGLCEEIECMVHQFFWGSSTNGRKVALVDWKDVQVLRAKYGVAIGIPENLSCSKISFMWRALTKVWPLIQENLIWLMGDGKNTRCWRDPWIPNVGPLVNLIPRHSSLDLDYSLSDMVSVNGTWNLDLFRIWVPKTVIQKIMGIPPLHLKAGVDRIIWGGSKAGSFSVKNAYGKIKERSWKLKEDA